jgi:zinc protease
VTSAFVPGKSRGSFQLVLQTKNTSAQEAIALAVQQMERIRTQGVSAAELAGAKQYLVGNFPLRLDTQAKLANFLTQVEYYNLGLDYPQRYPDLIGAVTQEDILRVARTYLHPESALLVIVANLQAAGLQ